MPKQVSCNSFYMFMVETKKRLEARGERFPRGMEDVVGVAAELWQNMPQEQKNVYKEKARDYKKSEEFSAHKKEVKGKLPKRMREDGGRRRPAARPVEDEEFVDPVPDLYPSEDEEAKEEFRRRKAKDRSEIMDAWRWNLADNESAVMDSKFFIVSFIYHCRTNTYSYFPAEFGLVEFTLNEGLKHEVSALLGPYNNLPPNLVEVAKQNFELHKIPFDQPVDGMVDDFARALDMILRICRPSKNMRRLYCISKEFNAVQGCVNFLQMQARQEEIRRDRISCVDDLFTLLCEWKEKLCTTAEKNAFDTCDGSTSMAPFYGHSELPCAYHKEHGVNYCALATAKRAMYYLLERVQIHYRFPLTPKHRPPPLPAGASASSLVNTAAMNLYLTRAMLEQVQGGAGASAMDDDTISTVTATTFTTRRMHQLHLGDDDDDIGMPSTLPTQLRGSCAVVPDSWNQNGKGTRPVPNAVVKPQSEQRAPSTYSHPAPSIAQSGRTSAAETSLSSRGANITWDQNKAFRDLVYNKQPSGGGNAQNDGRGRENNPGTSGQNGAAAAKPVAGQEALNAPVAAGGSANQQDVRPGCNFITGVQSSVINEFGGYRHRAPPVNFPPPNNVAPVRADFPGPRQRSIMTPRVSLPQAAPVRNVIPPSQNGRAVGDAAAVGATAGPPVKTASKVKQMLAERLQAQGGQPRK